MGIEHKNEDRKQDHNSLPTKAETTGPTAKTGSEGNKKNEKGGREYDLSKESLPAKSDQFRQEFLAKDRLKEK